jgi:hypothetical protein
MHNPKTDIIVAIAGLPPVADVGARILMMVVPRAAAHNTTNYRSPPEQV